METGRAVLLNLNSSSTSGVVRNISWVSVDKFLRNSDVPIMFIFIDWVFFLQLNCIHGWWYGDSGKVGRGSRENHRLERVSQDWDGGTIEPATPSIDANDVS